MPPEGLGLSAADLERLRTEAAGERLQWKPIFNTGSPVQEGSAGPPVEPPLPGDSGRFMVYTSDGPAERTAVFREVLLPAVLRALQPAATSRHSAIPGKMGYGRWTHFRSTIGFSGVIPPSHTLKQAHPPICFSLNHTLVSRSTVPVRTKCAHLQYLHRDLWHGSRKRLGSRGRVYSAFVVLEDTTRPDPSEREKCQAWGRRTTRVWATGYPRATSAHRIPAWALHSWSSPFAR